MLTAALYSITRQVFRPHTKGTEEVQCLPALAGLKQELLAEASLAISQPSSAATQARRRFFDRWDVRLNQLGPYCAESHAAPYATLRRLRHSLESVLVRFDREQLPLLQRLERDLAGP
jgi:hypothetical protein